MRLAYIFPSRRIVWAGVSLDLRSHLQLGAFSVELSVSLSTPSLHISGLEGDEVPLCC